MAMSGFICHDDYLQKTAKLTDEEVGRLFRALMRYHATGIADDVDGLESIAFDFIREDIDRTEAAYKVKCEKNRNNRLSAVVNNRQQSLTVVDDPAQKEKEKKKEKENDKENIKEKSGRFTPPTLEQVIEYCKERGNTVNPQKWFDYYSSNGWKVGKNPMKDWKAAVRTWEQNDRQDNRPAGKVVQVLPAQNYNQRSYNETKDVNAFYAELMKRQETS